MTANMWTEAGAFPMTCLRLKKSGSAGMAVKRIDKKNKYRPVEITYHGCEWRSDYQGRIRYRRIRGVKEKAVK